MIECLHESLESKIEASPLLVIEWIEAFKLYTFKTKYLPSLALSCLVNNLDITKFLMTDDSYKNDILSILDKYVVAEHRSIKNFDHNFSKASEPKPPPNSLVKDFLNKFSVSTLSADVYKWARPDRFDEIPNTMKHRSIKNFDHNFSKASELEDRRLLALQTLEASKHSSSQIKEIIKCIKYKDDNFAMAVASLAMAMKCLTAEHLNDAIPHYHYISQGTRRAVDAEVQALKDLQISSQSERIPSIKCEEFECFLVDDRETFDKLLSVLSNHKTRTVAFDVEASFVCQSEISSQDAALLQLAFIDNTVYLVDIYTLKKVLTPLDWETFFELFLRPRLRRIGFGIKNDVLFLQNAFPFLAKNFANKKPVFICVQEAVTLLSNNPETFLTFFLGKTPTFSLQNVTNMLLDVELEKDEQASNWLSRPLTEAKMKYAATDAFYTLKCFFKIKEKLNKTQWMDLKNVIYKVGEPLKVVQTNAFSLFKKKETFEEVVAHIQSVAEEIQASLSRKAEEILIVLEPPFLKYSSILKRCGFKTWDHRDADSKPDKKAKEMLREMESFLKKLSKEIRQNTFILTNKKTISIYLSDFENSLIFAQQDLAEAVVMEKIVRQTFSSIDFSTIHLRCGSCAKTDSHFFIPMAAYRSIYKSFATFKGFADNIEGLEDSLETFNDTFNSLPDDLKGGCSIDGEELIVKNDLGVFRFSINGKDCAVWENNDVTTFKCDTKLFKNENKQENVKFCWKCKVFF
uniref:3'-5' exonuclease domain-containing protein n=1 Tax=Panagrolaimus sp. ES5 TaxID=591445 RepID=A0AC34GP14_9BILA